LVDLKRIAGKNNRRGKKSIIDSTLALVRSPIGPCIKLYYPWGKK